MRTDRTVTPSRPAVAPLRRAGAAAIVVAAAGGLHLWLLAGLPLGMGRAEGPGVAALQVRQIVTAAPPAATPSETAAPLAENPHPSVRRAAQRSAAVPPHVAAAPRPEPTPTEVPVQPASRPSDELVPDTATAQPDKPTPPAALATAELPPAEALASLAPVTVDAASVVDVATTAAAAAFAIGGAPLPTYPTRMPPAARLQYDLRRGVLSGQGELVWQPAVEAYEMSIEGVAFGIPVLAWASKGGYDRAGLAPVRFLDRRRGRDLRAANFQRDKAVISYSGATLEYPLTAGAQDRLSWMVQLAAIVEAAGGRVAPGERFSMQVTGARGDADVWTFVAGPREDLDLPAGRVPRTLMFSRAPRKPHDTQVEVWLDPARHHLPVRMKLTSLPAGDSTEFLLRSAS